MSKARRLLEIVGDYNTDPKSTYNNPPTKPIRGSVTGLEANIKKLFKEMSIDADIDIKFVPTRRFGKEETKSSIVINLKSMTVDEFNKMSELPKFNSLVSSFGTDWGIVGNTIKVGKA